MISRRIAFFYRSQLSRCRRVPGRRDVEPLSPKMDQTKLKLRVVPQETPKHYDEHVKDFRVLFSL
jgi:hypothetical protein